MLDKLFIKELIISEYIWPFLKVKKNFLYFESLIAFLDLRMRADSNGT